MFNINGWKRGAARPERVRVVMSDDPSVARREIDRLAGGGEFVHLSAWPDGATVSDGAPTWAWQLETIGGRECEILRTTLWGGVIYVGTPRDYPARRSDITRRLRKNFGPDIRLKADDSKAGELAGETILYAYRAPTLGLAAIE
jgi:hypothetical protein